MITKKARNLLELGARAGDMQILVYIDGATDGTAELLAPFSDEITVIFNPLRRGKTYGMRRLVDLATGEILIFTDTNTIIDADAIVRLRAHFADPQTGCVCGHLEYRNPAASETSNVNACYWRLEEKVKNLESEMGCVIGADGSLFAVRGALYPAVPDDIIDDFFVPLHILCLGYLVVRADDVRCCELSVVDRREELQRKIRIACQAFNVHRLLWPRIRRLPALQLYCYISHKLLRWFTAWTLGGAAVFGAAGLVALTGAAGAVVITGGLVLSCAAYAAGVRPVRKVFEIWLALWATGLGVLYSLRGERFQTWAPAQSIR